MLKHQTEPLVDAEPPSLPHCAAQTSPGYHAAPDAQTCLLDHIEGRCSFCRLELALDIHVNDSLERSSAHETFILPPSLNLVLMLEGDLDSALGDSPLPMNAFKGAKGYLWVNRQPTRLERWVRAGQRVRKIKIGLPLNQLQILGNGAEMPPLLSTEDALSFAQWRPDKLALRHAEEICNADLQNSVSGNLAAGIAALSLLRLALFQGVSTGGPTLVSRRDNKRARQLRDHVLEHIDENLCIEDLAEHTGMSVSTLQRVFKSTYGSTVMDFIRTRRLELARLAILEEGRTVGEAAFDAGYASTASFSTAFQRQFGYPPSSCIRG